MNILTLESAVSVLTGGATHHAVTLDTIVFADHEVPNNLQVTEPELLTIHKLPGGGRLFDDGGSDPSSLSWEGVLLGRNALARALQLSALKGRTKAMTLAIAGRKWPVLLRDFAYTYSTQGIRISYHILLEIVTEIPSNAKVSLSGLSDSTRTNTASALSRVTGAISSVSSLVGSFTSSAQNVLGQVTPIASIFGFGTPLARAQDSLTLVQGLSASGQNLATLPTALKGTLNGLKSASGSLSDALQLSGNNLDSLQDGTVSSRVTAMQNLTVAVAALESKTSTDLAVKNAGSISQ